MLASSTTRSGTSALASDAKAFATSSSCPVSVSPFGRVTVAMSGEVFPPLWNAAMIWFAALSPGWPGSEKSTVSRSLTLLVTAMPATATTNQTSITIRRCRRTSSPQRRMASPLAISER